jgi:hypothetical protein
MLTALQRAHLKTGNEIVEQAARQLARYHELHAKRCKGLTGDERREYIRLKIRRRAVGCAARVEMMREG